jgi:Protein of unknown function (DUF1064)
MTRVHWPAPKGAKYRAAPCVIDGLRFASTAEGRRYAELKLLARAGTIRDLRCQPVFPLTAIADDLTCSKVAVYRADFSYQEQQAGAWVLVVEDVKGVRTPVYRLKKKWFETQYGVAIREITRRPPRRK